MGAGTTGGAGGGTPQQRGQALERRVARLLRRAGKPCVRTNVFLTDRHGNRSEVDVTWGRFPWTRRYVECKAYRATHPVPLEDVAKFREVLRVNGVPARRGMVVTTSRYTPRCQHVGVALVDGAGLRAWERRPPRVRRARTRRRTSYNN